MQQERGLGVIVTARSLVLQSVQRRSAGSYDCQASNVQGDGVSGTVNLTVQCEFSVSFSILISRGVTVNLSVQCEFSVSFSISISMG